MFCEAGSSGSHLPWLNCAWGLGWRFWKQGSRVSTPTPLLGVGFSAPRMVCWKGQSHSLLAWMRCLSGGRWTAWINRSYSVFSLWSGKYTNTYLAGSWHVCSYSVKANAIASRLPFWSRGKGGWEGGRHYPVVSTAGWARNTAWFTLILLVCVLGPMLNFPLEEKLESSRLGVFSCFKFQPLSAEEKFIFLDSSYLFLCRVL